MQFIPVTIPVELKPELCRKWQFVKRWWNSFFPWTQKQPNKIYAFQIQSDFLSRWCEKLPWWGSTNIHILMGVQMQIFVRILASSIVSIDIGKYLVHISDWSGWWDALWWIGSRPHVRFPFHLILHQQQICRPSKTFQFGIYSGWRYQSSNEKAEVEKGDAKDKVSGWRRMQQKVKWRQL